jgi:hypothetical protein
MNQVTWHLDDVLACPNAVYAPAIMPESGLKSFDAHKADLVATKMAEVRSSAAAWGRSNSRQVNRKGRTVWLRFGHEMNGRSRWKSSRYRLSSTQAIGTSGAANPRVCRVTCLHVEAKENTAYRVYRRLAAPRQRCPNQDCRLASSHPYVLGAQRGGHNERRQGVQGGMCDL